ncbi:mycothiol synthase [Serinibacter arcticus]|uniref:Mycothiol acetyltransferase n=1 Tax=Serinibacter arcticus TaxID=1655435 RepID=A0A4Z1E335_9MICO|nr:mycothiol synthase [Serinibacter arcticus]TGO05670.1 Acetyl-CoA:Cys-GlcN-Ins acetyltransferase, mycothiol synthase MshD [Serinibacter arcticus]
MTCLVPPVEPEVPDDAARAQVLALAERAEAVDGVAPLSEAHLLALREPGVTQLLHRGGADGAVDGAAIHADGSVEIVVDPAARRRGIASLLAASVEALSVGTAYWAHGDLPPARGFAAAVGLEPVRELLKLGRALTAQDAARAADPEVRSLAQRTGDDARERHLTAWLALNALAFADHPEQGRWTRGDLDARLGEDWFDPSTLWVLDAEGFEPTGAAASVWVKHPAGESAEVYVLASHPDRAGQGLGRRLLEHALGEIARAGADDVELYVDGGNAAARRLYERAGFTVRTRDVQYVTTSRPAGEGATIGA